MPAARHRSLGGGTIGSSERWPASVDASDHGERSPDREYCLATKERIGGNRACIAVARKLLKRSYHTLRELGEEALAPA